LRIAFAEGISNLRLVFYASTIPLFLWLQSLLFSGYIKGNAVRVSERQFPEAFALLKSHSEALGLARVPAMYVMHGHGMLNAFAVRLARRNYIVLYADVLELAYQEGEDAVSFIIGHELGHIKRNHVGFLKAFCTWPARWMPFLGNAYSRACEYTCDNIGFNLCPKGAAKGVLILAVGKMLYKKIDVEQLLFDYKSEEGFAVTLAEMLSTHPMLIKRLAVINQLKNDHSIQADDFIISPRLDPNEFRQKNL
jgi:Zn-dependent protease with chaperone function